MIRNPIRSETDAFHLALGGARLTGPRRTLAGDRLARKLRRRGAGGCELRVVAPIVVSRAHYLASDVGICVTHVIVGPPCSDAVGHSTSSTSASRLLA